MIRIACIICIVAAALLISACEATRIPIDVARDRAECDRSLDTEPYKGSCWGKEAFDRARQGGGGSE
jgi:hypothetical protein